MLNRTALAAILTLVAFQFSAAQKLPPGPQVMTFFSAADDTEQPYGLYIPRNYDERKKYPLVIMLHGAGSNHRLSLRRVFGKSNANGETDVEASRYFPEWPDVDYVVASPFARGTSGYQGIMEGDVYAVLEDVKKRFSIDEDRIYLTGLSMGGGGTLWLGLTRPDIWAALAPVCPAPPAGTDQYASNARTLPMHFFHGDQDRAVPVSVSRDWVKRIRDMGGQVEYKEYPGVDHNSWENAYADGLIFKWFDQFKRNRFPAEVEFSTARYKYNRAYWVKIDDLTPGTTATVHARFVKGNELQVDATNVKGFTLKLAGHPSHETGKPLALTLNGKKTKVVNADSISFYLKDSKWVAGTASLPPSGKRPGAEGPLSEAFAQRHVYVYGTADQPSPEKLKERMDIAAQAANWSAYRNAFLGRIMFFPRIVADKDVRPSDLASCNLILFGTKESNLMIAKFADRLPMHLTSGQDNLSLLYIFPVNDHYVAINSGLPWWTGASQGTSPMPPLPHTLLNKLPDFVLFRESASKVILDGNFDTMWQLSDGQKKVLNENGVQTR